MTSHEWHGYPPMVPAFRDILLESRLLASTAIVFNEKRGQGERQRGNTEI